eukprot:8039035-Pyramimonas_sp.AAC.1
MGSLAGGEGGERKVPVSIGEGAVKPRPVGLGPAREAAPARLEGAQRLHRGSSRPLHALQMEQDRRRIHRAQGNAEVTHRTQYVRNLFSSSVQGHVRFLQHGRYSNYKNIHSCPKRSGYPIVRPQLEQVSLAKLIGH